MNPESPRRIAIDHDDYHAAHVGRTADGRQFFLTCPFEPAVRGEAGGEFNALYLFDGDGEFVSAQIEAFGPRGTFDLAVKETANRRLLEALGPVTFGRIEVAPFEVDRFGTKFGLIGRDCEDPEDVLAVEAQPGNYMAFFEPWNSGEYDT
jgi:hypothetical protein